MRKVRTEKARTVASSNARSGTLQHFRQLAARIKRLEDRIFPQSPNPDRNRMRLVAALAEISEAGLARWLREFRNRDLAILFQALPPVVLTRLKTAMSQGQWREIREWTVGREPHILFVDSLVSRGFQTVRQLLDMGEIVTSPKTLRSLGIGLDRQAVPVTDKRRVKEQDARAAVALKVLEDLEHLKN